MIKRTIVLLLAVVINTPVLRSNATTVIETKPESNSMIKVEDTLKDYKYTNPALLKIEHLVQEKEIENKKKKQLEEQIRQENERIQSIANENARKENVHVYAANVTSISGIKVEELKQIFINIGKPKMAQYAQAFIDAEKQYKVNALFLAAIVAQESGWGSKAGGTNGTNLTGHCVYNSSSVGTTFNSGYESILATAKLLKEDYLTPGAKSFNGYGVQDVNTRYCLKDDMKTTDYKWTSFVTSIENNLEKVYHHNIKTIEKI